MKELLVNLDSLIRGRLCLEDCKLAGVPYGASAANIVREQVRRVTCCPLVSEYRNDESFDADGNKLNANVLIDLAINSEGILHYDNGISFKVVGGIVTRFSLYGPALDYFTHKISTENAVEYFGVPDRVLRDEVNGELMGFAHYYRDANKWLWWTPDEDLLAITLGDSEDIEVGG